MYRGTEIQTHDDMDSDIDIPTASIVVLRLSNLIPIYKVPSTRNLYCPKPKTLNPFITRKAHMYRYHVNFTDLQGAPLKGTRGLKYMHG